MASIGVGESVTFGCTGGVQSFTVPEKGIYKLEVFGAGGGGAQGGAGGYGAGYRKLDEGDVLYICVGGAGAANRTGGYNGGGTGGEWAVGPTTYDHFGRRGGGGGGATHIALTDGTLEEIGEAGLNRVLIVAGGGGGQTGGGTLIPDNPVNYSTTFPAGAPGGGESGGTAVSPEDSIYTSAGGTQTDGYAFGCGQDGGTATENRYSCAGHGRGGGGGGLYGGRAQNTMNQYGAGPGGGGGSGYIGGVPAFTERGVAYAPTWQAGYGGAQRDGSAIITYVAKGELPVSFDGTMITAMVFNGQEVTGLVVDGVRLFIRRIGAWLRGLREAMKEMGRSKVPPARSALFCQPLFSVQRL